MTALYNELEAYPAQWLRNLIDEDFIAKGTVNERSIERLEPGDLDGVKQFHAFAGIGVWSHALRLAGWPDDREVWTGSCPCQPFSTAGKRKGTEDERHLFPVWYELIKERRPAVVFGEQVASPAGRDWLASVRIQMEALGYEVGAADLCAAGIGAPHIRQRLYFGAVRLGDSGSAGSGRYTRTVPSSETQSGEEGSSPWDLTYESFVTGPDWKCRPIEPGTLPLVAWYPTRLARQRAYGNAICPQITASFISAFMDSIGEALQRRLNELEADAKGVWE